MNNIFNTIWKLHIIVFQELFPNMHQNFKDDGLDHVRSNIVCLIILFYLSQLISLILTRSLMKKRDQTKELEPLPIGIKYL
jgi:hypothetical protein